MTVIAIEEHWMLPELDAALRAVDHPDPSLVFNDMGDSMSRLVDLGAARLAIMDEQGIDLSILSLTPPGTHPLSPEQARALAQAANDAVAEAVSAAPTRFRALSLLPMSSPKDIVAELERTKKLGFVGTMVYGRTGDVPLDDKRYEDFFAAAAALRQPVFLHPQIPSEATRDASYRGISEFADLGLATAGWGWHIEAATAALRLIVSGTFDRHPELQIILGHWGELLLFWLDRASGLSRAAGLPRPVSDYVKTNFHITASGMLNPALLQHVLTVTTPDRLLFSTDYPFQRPTRDDINTFGAHFDTDANRQAFFSGNAERLFGLTTDTTPIQEQP